MYPLMSILVRYKALFVLGCLFFSLIGCGGMAYKKTVESVDIQKFMGKWYVVAGRTSFLEKGAHNSLEEYFWNEKENRIDIRFSFRKGSFKGKLKKIPQKAWIENKKTKAHWKVQPIWPLKLDYLVIALDESYQWSIIGVPSQSYVWIMTRKPNPSAEEIDLLISKLDELNYSSKDIKLVPQKW